MNPMKNRIAFVLLFVSVCSQSAAQDLLEILENEQQDTVTFVDATFKTTRIAFGHSLETRQKGILEVFVSNRFWDRPVSSSQSFMADKVNARIALEYAITDRLSTAIGASTWDGRFDTYFKYRLLQQQKGIMPISLTLFQNASYYSIGIPNPYIEDDFMDRMAFTTQALIGAKVNRELSLQIAPTFIYRGLQYYPEDPTEHFAVGFGGRYKLGNHVSFVSEYYAVINKMKSRDTYGPFALGVNWELGDIMLQFMLTNSPYTVEDAMITQTRYNFNFRNPNLNFGFNFSYIIHTRKGLKK